MRYTEKRGKKRILNHLFFQIYFNNTKKMITILFVGIYLDGQLVEHGSKGFRFGTEIW